MHPPDKQHRKFSENASLSKKLNISYRKRYGKFNKDIKQANQPKKIKKFYALRENLKVPNKLGNNLGDKEVTFSILFPDL